MVIKHFLQISEWFCSGRTSKTSRVLLHSLKLRLSFLPLAFVLTSLVLEGCSCSCWSQVEVVSAAHDPVMDWMDKGHEFGGQGVPLVPHNIPLKYCMLCTWGVAVLTKVVQLVFKSNPACNLMLPEVYCPESWIGKKVHVLNSLKDMYVYVWDWPVLLQIMWPADKCICDRMENVRIYISKDTVEGYYP